ncbi:MAG: GerMN domain-containing protein [Thermodesulfobacteriota bacterium]
MSASKPLSTNGARPKIKLPKKFGGRRINLKKIGLWVMIPIVLLILISFYLLTFPEKKNYQDPEFIWRTVRGTPEGDLLIRGKHIDQIKGNVKDLIRALNKSDQDPESFRTPKDREAADPPKVKLKEIKNKTAFVEIINAEYLTQRMGSSGAEEFLAVVTYTLTEHPNIQIVHFIFEEGDHAVPGPYSRKYFLTNWKVGQ